MSVGTILQGVRQSRLHRSPFQEGEGSLECLRWTKMLVSRFSVRFVRIATNAWQKRSGLLPAIFLQMRNIMHAVSLGLIAIHARLTFTGDSLKGVVRGPLSASRSLSPLRCFGGIPPRFRARRSANGATPRRHRFYIDARSRMVLLHGFIKKTQKTPTADWTWREE